MIRHAREHAMSFLPEDDLSLYMKEVGRNRILGREEEALLLERAQAGDRQALNALVEANLRFVVSICMNYRNCGVPMGDLVNEGNLGLIRAVERFQAGYGAKFISYAVWWIRQAILLALPRQSGAVSLPPSWMLDRSRIRRAQSRLMQRLGRAPSMEELAAETGMTLAMAREHAADMSTGTRFSDPGRSENVEEMPAGNSELAPDSGTRKSFLRKHTEAALATLDRREAEVLRSFYGLDTGEPISLEEIGGRIGLSRERIRQIKDAALAKLRLPSRRAEVAAARTWATPDLDLLKV